MEFHSKTQVALEFILGYNPYPHGTSLRIGTIQTQHHAEISQDNFVRAKSRTINYNNS